MDASVLSKNNHLFFYVSLAPILMDRDFENIVNALTHRSKTEMKTNTPREGFETLTFNLLNGEVGYLQIGMASAVLLSDITTSWWFKIPNCISGKYNDGCCIPNQDGNDIILKIIGYETPKGLATNHYELEHISDDTPLGIVVAVCTVPHGEAIPEKELVCVWEPMDFIPF